MKYFPVVISEPKNGTTVCPDHLLIIKMIRWPVIVVKYDRKHLALQQTVDPNSFFNNYRQILSE